MIPLDWRIGTAAVIAVIGLGSSAEKALEQSIDDLGGRTLYVSPGQNRRGAVTKGMIPLDIKDAEALVSTSLWEDPGFVLLEAMYCNTIVLSSDCQSGPKEILNESIPQLPTTRIRYPTCGEVVQP